MTDTVDHCDETTSLSQLASHGEQSNSKHIIRAKVVDTIFSHHWNQILAWLNGHKHRLRPIAMLVALAVFCIGLFLSLRVSPDVWGRVESAPLLIILFITLPVGLLINAADFQVMARLSGVTVNFGSAAEVVLYSRAASLLPLPGSFAVRMAALKVRGITFKRSSGLMFLFTAIWGGVGFCFSAVWLSIQAALSLTLAFATVGVGLLAVCFWFVSYSKLEWRSVIVAAALRFALVALEAITLMMAVRAIGVDVHYQQTAILVVAPFLAGVVPTGFGLREAILAALAPIVGIDPATGFLAGVVARVSGMVFLVYCTMVGFFLRRFVRK